MADGELGDRAVGQPAGHLDRALAEGARPHDDRAAAVLEGAGEQLGRAHRAAVDQCDQGPGGVAAGLGVQGELLAVDVVGGDQAAVEEGGGGGDRLGDQAAGVAAQVEDDPRAGRGPADGVADHLAGPLGEGGDPDHGGTVGEPADGHGVGGQAGPAQVLGPRARAAFQAEADGRTGVRAGGVAAQQGDDLGDRTPVDLLAVDAAQPVPGADPGLGGGRTGGHTGHLDPSVPLPAGGQAHAGVGAVEGLLELLVLAPGVDGVPAVAAAADGAFRGLDGGRALGHGLGGGAGDVLPAADGGGGGRRPGGGAALAHRQRAGGGAGDQHAGEHQGQGGPAAEAAGLTEQVAT
ncbi:hypothetical protein GCM10020295_51180 [Streptomyces cinereospinus]